MKKKISKEKFKEYQFKFEGGLCKRGKEDIDKFWKLYMGDKKSFDITSRYNWLMVVEYLRRFRKRYYIIIDGRPSYFSPSSNLQWLMYNVLEYMNLGGPWLAYGTTEEITDDFLKVLKNNK